MLGTWCQLPHPYPVCTGELIIYIKSFSHKNCHRHISKHFIQLNVETLMIWILLLGKYDIHFLVGRIQWECIIRHQACSRHSTYISNYEGTRLAGVATPTQLPVKTQPHYDAPVCLKCLVVSVGLSVWWFGKLLLSAKSLCNSLDEATTSSKSCLTSSVWYDPWVGHGVLYNHAIWPISGLQQFSY